MRIPLGSDCATDTDRGLDGLYHTAQEKIWDGREVLEDLFKKYEDFEIDVESISPLKNILSIILWGEYAAWSVSSELSAQFEDYGAKAAAVSQAHDEARHFYVIRDYIKRRFGDITTRPKKPALRVLEKVGDAESLAKKLLGMQLMIEPVAITIFRFLRKSEVDPILVELLEYFEKDEARHIALGVKYLPKLLKEMSGVQLVDFLWWQIRLIIDEIRGLKAIESDLVELGLDPKEVFEFAEKKQLHCLKMLSAEMGINDNLWRPLIGIIRFKKQLSFYPRSDHNIFKKIINSLFEKSTN